MVVADIETLQVPETTAVHDTRKSGSTTIKQHKPYSEGYHIISTDPKYNFHPKGPPQGGLEITLSRRFFTQITPRNCLKFMFTPSLSNHTGCQIDHSRYNAFFSLNSRFDAQKYVE